MYYIIILSLLWFLFLPEGTGLNDVNGVGQSRADGVARNTSGQSDTCCCGGCGVCGACTQGACWVTATMHGLTARNCHLCFATWRSSLGSPSGTWDINKFSSSPCRFAKVINGPTYTRRSGPNITGSPNCIIDVVITADNVDVVVGSNNVVAGVGGFGAFPSGNICGSVTPVATATCPVSASVPNSNTDCNDDYLDGVIDITFHYGPWPFNPFLP